MQQLTSDTTPLFSTLSRAAVARITESMHLTEARRRTVIFRAGDPPAGMYVIAGGVVKLTLPPVRDSEKVIGLLRPGETFGISAVVLGEPHVFTAVTVRDSSIGFLPKEKLFDALHRERGFARQLMRELSRGLHDILADVQMNATQSGIQRTATFLLQHISSRPGRSGVSVALPARKGDIASKLALTAAHFSRLLHELAAAGVVALDGPTVTIKNVKKLRQFALGEPK